MNLKPVTVSDYDAIKSFFVDQTYNLSIYSPASLVAWSNDIFRAYYAIVDGVLFIGCEAEKTPKDNHLILPVSQNSPCTPSDLHQYARQFGFDRYWYAPGDYLGTVDRSELEALFICEAQKEFDDYVYLTEDLSRLKGNKFVKKRNLINQFTREYLRNDRVVVEDIRPEHVQECLQFLDIWCEKHTCDTTQESNLACEKSALVTTLNNLNRLESRGILIRVDGVVSAFGIGSRLNRTTGTLNFEKAFSEIKGLYQFLDNECAKRLFSEFKYINKESDMNLPNLAESKLSYNPVLRINSFALTLR